MKGFTRTVARGLKPALYAVVVCVVAATVYAQQRGGTPRTFHIVPALVDRENMVVQALGTHLHFGHAEIAQPAELLWCDLIRTRLNDQADIPVMGSFIERMSPFKLSFGDLPLW